MGKIKPNKLALLLAIAMLSSALSVSVSADDSNKSHQEIRSNLKAEPTASSSPSSPLTKEGEEAKQEVSKEDIPKEDAERLFRQYVSIPKEYVLRSASYGSYRLVDGVQNTWGMEFVKVVNNKHAGSISVTMNASTGQLLRYYSYTDNANAKPSYPLKVDRTEAQKIAIAFIDEVAKEYRGSVQYNEKVGAEILPPLSGEVRHRLRYDRVVNGIPYLDNYIQFEVNSEGHVLNFELIWDDTIKFPVVSGKLTLDEAKRKIAEIASPELRYIVPHNTQDKKLELSYDLSPFVIEAVTGEKLTDPMYGYGVKVSDKPLTEKPLGAEPKETKITEAQARKIVEEVMSLPTNKHFNGSSFNEHRDETTGKLTSYWLLDWVVKKDGKDFGSIAASVNGSTGVIQNFYQYYNNSEDVPVGNPISVDKAVEKAIGIVKKQLPWLTGELYLIKPDKENDEKVNQNESKEYGIGFLHKVHGATVDFNYIKMSINATSGEVRHSDASVSGHIFPETKPVTIDKEAAIKQWMSFYDTELTYRVMSQYEWKGKPASKEMYETLMATGEATEADFVNKSEIKLVYQLIAKPRNEAVFLDAMTGIWRNGETGEVTQLAIPAAKDIAGHWAEQSLQLMVAYRALDLEHGNVLPNQGITRGEIIKMLVLARAGGSHYGYEQLSGRAFAKLNSSFSDVAADSSYFAYIESALEQNLIDLGDGKFNPEGKVTRDELSELIVRALGYNTLADYDHIFKANFKDSAQIENKGQSSIVVGLKIMSLSDGKFLPKKQITRAEASVAFLRYLQKRSELQEAPLRM